MMLGAACANHHRLLYLESFRSEETDPMTNYIHRKIAAPVLSLMVLTAPVLADSVTISFDGTIVNFFNAPVAGVEVGTSFTGSFTYDSNLPETVLRVPDISTYSPATVEIQFTSPSAVNSTLTFGNAFIRIDDNNASDAFTVIAGNSSGLPFDFNGLTVRDLRIYFIDASATIFSDASLPASLDLADFGVAEVLLTQTLTGSSVDFSSTGRIDSLVQGPPPDAVAPIASAGDDFHVNPGETAFLDGTASSDDITATANLEYSWILNSAPDGSSASLTNEFNSTPNLSTDLPGDYVVDLVVMDENGNISDVDTVVITADLSMNIVFRKVVDTATLVPGTTIPFSNISGAVIENEVVAFSGYHSDGTRSVFGVYSESEGVLDTVADTDTVFPGETSSFSYAGMANPSIDGGEISFQSWFRDNSNVNRHSIMATNSGALQTIAESNAVAPGDTRSFNSVYSQSGGSDPAFVGRLNGCDEYRSYRWWHGWFGRGHYHWYTYCSVRPSGIYSSDDSIVSAIATTQTTAPDSTTLFRYFNGLSRDGSNIAFTGTDRNYRDGVFHFDASGLERVFDDNSPSPFDGTLLNWLGNPVIDNDEVTFIGSGYDATSGQYRADVISTNIGGARFVVGTGVPIPDGTAVLLSPGNVAVDEGETVFNGSYVDPAGNWRQGIFLRIGNRLLSVAQPFDNIGGKQVSYLYSGREALSKRSVAILAYFTDGTSGIYVASLDSDGDTRIDNADNCVETANPFQEDNDDNGVGDACEDRDGDTVLDVTDNCPTDINLNQENSDDDVYGDACDVCPFDTDPQQLDQDEDGIGNLCDLDADNDTVANLVDNCPLVQNADQDDLDIDGLGDPCDSDKDGDGISNQIDGRFVGSFIDESLSPSDDFTDQGNGGVSFGTVKSSSGLDLIIEDANDPTEGIRIDAVSGSGNASIQTCDIKPPDGRVRITEGDSVVVTCGSITVRALRDPVELELNSVAVIVGSAATVTVEEIDTQTIAVSVPPEASVPVTMLVGEGMTVSIPTDVSVSVMEIQTGPDGDHFLFEIENYASSQQPIIVEVDGQQITYEPGAAPAIAVNIDIKPGATDNSINLRSNGNVPVAILSTPSFDATLVDPLTVTLAAAPVQLKGRGTPQASEEDTNGDGIVDLVVHVDTSALELSSQSVDAILEGTTFSGMNIRASDVVTVVRE